MTRTEQPAESCHGDSLFHPLCILKPPYLAVPMRAWFEFTSRYESCFLMSGINGDGLTYQEGPRLTGIQVDNTRRIRPQDIRTVKCGAFLRSDQCQLVLAGGYKPSTSVSANRESETFTVGQFIAVKPSLCRSRYS